MNAEDIYVSFKTESEAISVSDNWAVHFQTSGKLHKMHNAFVSHVAFRVLRADIISIERRLCMFS